MKMFSPLISAACAVLYASGIAAQEANVLPLDKRPTYQTLTAAGFKLLNPDPSYGNTLQTTRYRSEPCRILLRMGEARSAALDLSDNNGIEFLKHELTAPGTHYPPALPVQDSTPVWSLSFTCQYPDLEAARAALASVEKPLKVDMIKVDAWIQNKFWESAPVLKLDGTIPDAATEIQLYYQPKDEASGTAAETNLIFKFQWNSPHTPERQSGSLRGGQRSPRPMIVPPQPGQQSQPGQPR